MKFNEAALESAIIELLGQQGYPHVRGGDLALPEGEVLIRDDLATYLAQRYAAENITATEIQWLIHELASLPASDLYASNKAIIDKISNGVTLRREDPNAKDFFVEFIDYSPAGDGNSYKLVNQLTIQGHETHRIPDGILYINGIPLVVFEFKTAISENATLYDAHQQLTVRYCRDIPELMKYNAFCVISDGVNNKMGSTFAGFDFFSTWRRVSQTGSQLALLPDGSEFKVADASQTYGINSLYTMVSGLFDSYRLRDVIRHFVFFPDKSHIDLKVVCRYPQYYATKLLLENIRKHQRTSDNPQGDGKGGTYFGTTGCGKSFTMLFLTRLLMRSTDFASPTIVLITDRTDLDEQLSKDFCNATEFIGDNVIQSVESRADLRVKLKGRQSGGVFLTTIHKFTEDAELLSERSNVICISDEAHRSQINLDQKITIDENKGTVTKSFGFAKYLHDSLPNATYVGFTGTPVDGTLDVFGDIVDSYTMTESVEDEITVPIVYEGRAAKVILSNEKLCEIEDYYQQCADSGSSEYQIEESKKASANMNAILGDPDRLHALAADFVEHYERRVAEGSSVKGKAMFVCSSRQAAWALYQEIVALRPEWAEIKTCDEGSTLSEEEQKKIMPMERIKMVMTRGKDDPALMYEALGSKDYRKELDRQFKLGKSNFRIAIVVDMWLTGFDVPFLDTMYIDKPLQLHSLIQTISRVNRKFEGKAKGLVVDYIGLKKQLNQAMARYSKSDKNKIEDIESSVIIVRDHLDLLAKLFHKFDSAAYFSGQPGQQLQCLNLAAEYAMAANSIEKRFMALVKRLKAAYDICSGSGLLTENERDYIHFYMAVRSIVYKLTKGDRPDAAQMNARVREMIAEALQSNGVEEVMKLGDDGQGEIDIFSPEYLANIAKIKLPNTKIKLLQQMLAKAITEFQKVNKVKGIDFSKKLQSIVELYNERDEGSEYIAEVWEDITNQLVDMISDLHDEMSSFEDMGIDFEEKSFYDILMALAKKYDFKYPEEKAIALAKAVKRLVDEKAKYTDWSQRDDIKAELYADLIMLLDEYGYPPVANDEAYKEVLEQAENFKKNRG